METTQWDVIGLGCAAVDDLLYLPGYPPPDGRMRVERSERRCGGLTATALIAAARLGSRCAYAGALGSDPESQFVRASLAAEGIDLSTVTLRENARPIHSRILVDTTSGSRTILFEVAGETGANDEIQADIVLGARVVLLDQYGAAGSIRCAQAARQGGIPIVADLDTRDRPGFGELLDLTDHLILGEGFAMEVTGAQDGPEAVRRLWSEGRALAAVTAGERGYWWSSRETQGSVQWAPAYKIMPLDTTGCGDVFHGAYASSLAKGLPIPECLDIASAAAALKASVAVIPSEESVERFRILHGDISRVDRPSD